MYMFWTKQRTFKPDDMIHNVIGCKRKKQTYLNNKS